jgi:hypothetical protein
MFPSSTCRLNAAPPARQQDNCIFAVPVPGRPVFAARVGVDVLPKNSLGIFPNSDSQLQYPERSPPIGAITTSHATVLMHRFYKFCYRCEMTAHSIVTSTGPCARSVPTSSTTRGMRQWFHGLRSAVDSGSFAKSTSITLPIVPSPAQTRATRMLARWAIAPQVARSRERSSPDKPG